MSRIFFILYLKSVRKHLNENVMIPYQFISYFPDNIADVQPAPVINKNYKLMFSVKADAAICTDGIY
jgi:hypothetical protein